MLSIRPASPKDAALIGSVLRLLMVRALSALVLYLALGLLLLFAVDQWFGLTPVQLWAADCVLGAGVLVWLPILLHLIFPGATTRYLTAFNGWLRAHGKVILICVLVAVGGIMVINGIYGLAVVR